MVTTAAPPAEPVVEVEPTPPAVVEQAAPPVAEVPVATSPAAETPAAVPVATQPAPTEPPVAAVPPTPVIPPEIQQYITKLEEQNRAAQQQNETTILANAVASHASQLAQEIATEYQITPEQALPYAQKLAKQQGDILYKQYTADRARQGQINAAFDIAKEYGVDARMLMNLSTPEAMRQAATQATASSKRDAELAALKAENEALKKGRVPAQTFASSQGAATQVADNSNIDALYMGWERANPNSERPNPYQAQYRKFLYG